MISRCHCANGKLRSWWVLALVSTLLGCAPETPALRAGETSVLWLTLCTLRPDRLGAYGHSGGLSPEIDRLAAKGVVFERALSSAPWTRAAIAAMVTGTHPRALGFSEPEEAFVVALPETVETVAERFAAAGYSTLGVTANPNTNASFGFGQGYDAYRGAAEEKYAGIGNKRLVAEDVAAAFLEQLSGQPDDRPFFAHLVFIDVHKPFQYARARQRLGDFEPESGPFHEYDRQLRYLDDVLGELLGALAERGRTNLLVVVNADHGEGFREAHEEDDQHGEQLYNSTVWVPLIVSHPALASSARRIPELVQSVDVMPTLFELLGLPANSAHTAHTAQIDGRSLAAGILGTGPLPARAFAVVETRLPAASRSAVVADGWKLIEDDLAQPPSHVLYRYAEDPLETHERSATEPDTVERLVATLHEWQEDQDARAGPHRTPAAPSESERDALRALGYLDEPVRPRSEEARQTPSDTR